MNNIRNKLIRDQIIFDDENNPSTSMADVIWSRTVLDAVFDQTDSDEITLRKILDDMKEEIKNNGTGYIRFPVTSVNGMYDDVIITKDHINLGRVNNTADMEKPLSDPQRNDILTILSNYDFGIDLVDLNSHLINYNNPHQTTINQLNHDGSVDNMISSFISNHDTSNNSHGDIRNIIDTAISNGSTAINSLDSHLTDVSNSYSDHIINPMAHGNIFLMKEDIENKVSIISDSVNYSNIKYPTSKAVVDYITNTINNLDVGANIDEYVAGLDVVNTTQDLPMASEAMYRKVYLIKNRTGTNYNAIAICIKNGIIYSWDIKDFSIAKYDPQYFHITPNGMSLNIDALPVSADVYTKGEADHKFLQSVVLGPGPNNGSINYKLSTDSEIVNKNIQVTGLMDLAYMETVGSDQINAGAIKSFHIEDGSIGNDQIGDWSITNIKLTGMCVDTHNIMDRCVEEYKLADRSVSSRVIDYYAITHEHLAEGSVNNSKLQPNSVAEANLMDASISTSKYKDLSITGAKIINNTLVNLKLAQMTAFTVKGNMSSSTTTPVDVPLSSFTDTMIMNITNQQLSDLGTKLLPYGYTHPATHPPTIIAQNTTNRFVTDAEKAAWNSKAPGTHTHNYLPSTGGTVTGNLTVTGNITASQVFSAVWNDIAELFKKDDINEIFNPGDIIELNPETGNYRKSSNINSPFVVGVMSDQYGYLMGGLDDLSIDDNLKLFIPVGLAGRVDVNVIGDVKAGDLISASHIEGVGMASCNYKPGSIIGKALENKIGCGKGKVNILIMNI